jgi:FolB domain-containing protein
MSIDHPFSLSVNRLALPVFLGVGEEERSRQQTVYISVTLAYGQTPDCMRDDAADYFCYDTLCRKLLETAASRQWSLIEYLANKLLRAVRQSAPAQADIRLKLHKPLPVSLVGYEVDGATVELFNAGVQA